MADDGKIRKTFTTDEGHTFWQVDGKLHSENDAPAVIYANGARWWYRDGEVHRVGKPAVVFPNGVEEWWQNNQRHRDGGPAVTYPNATVIEPSLRGVKQWWTKGQKIREDVPAPVQAYRAAVAKAYSVNFGGKK